MIRFYVMIPDYELIFNEFNRTKLCKITNLVARYLLINESTKVITRFSVSRKRQLVVFKTVRLICTTMIQFNLRLILILDSV